MNYKSKLSGFLASLILISTIIFTVSCDEINHPYKDGSGSNTGTGLKKVILEDYTGHRCGNCPEAHEKAREIVESSNDRVIVIAIHEGAHAVPLGNSATYNFRTKDGKEIDDVFKAAWGAGTPNGMIDRAYYDDKRIINPSEWEKYVTQRLKETAKMTIEITPEYNTETREITADVSIEYLANSSINDNLCVYMLEDSIVKYQLNDLDVADPHKYNYVHMHVFRGAMSGVWGNQISSGEITSGAKFVKTVKFTIPADKDWVPKNMKLVAFVHDMNTKEIWQAEEVKLLK